MFREKSLEAHGLMTKRFKHLNKMLFFLRGGLTCGIQGVGRLSLLDKVNCGLKEKIAITRQRKMDYNNLANEVKNLLDLVTMLNKMNNEVREGINGWIESLRKAKIAAIKLKSAVNTLKNKIADLSK
jgi:hypothetical protein